MDILVEPGERPIADRHHPVLLPLALPDQQRVALAVHVAQLQPGQFLAADAGRIQGLHEGPVAEPQRVVTFHRGIFSTLLLLFSPFASQISSDTPANTGYQVPALLPH